MKRLIFTIVSGSNFSSIAEELVLPRMRKYAEKVGADFLQISNSDGYISPFFKRLDIYEFLNTWERVIYLDADIIIKDNASDLFDYVPEDELGLFDETVLLERDWNHPENVTFLERYNEQLITAGESPLLPNAWNGKYYNTGVIVASTKHKILFTPHNILHPIDIPDWDQDYINYLLVLLKMNVFDIGHNFNAIHWWRKCPFLNCTNSNIQFIHAAGNKNRKREVLLEILDTMNYTVSWIK
jgi:lipopolysaccharide biosynthesis glycosyltransferase